MVPSVPTQPVLEIDESFIAETDSAYDESIGTASYASSLSSSIKNYQYENGRRYHAYHEGAYIVPNDEEEQERMDLLHHIYRLTLKGELQLAPIRNPQRVLDLGTGTGIWAVQFADENPSTQVIGTDLSPIQSSWVPPNCTFEVDDFEAPWVYKTKFDYIHGRELEGCVADEDQLFRQAFANLKPGGYFEFDGGYAEYSSDDGTHIRAENTQLFTKEVREAANRFGKSFDNVPLWKEKMQQAGFVDVTQYISKIPIGAWPKDKDLKEIGRFEQVQQIKAVKSYMPALFSRVLGWSQTEMEALMAKIEEELKDRSLHMYLRFYFVYGRKP